MVTTMTALPPPVGMFSEKQFSFSISKTLRGYLGLLSWTWINGRYITLLTKVYIVKAMVFPVVMYGHESRTIKKAEHQSECIMGLVLLLKYFSLNSPPKTFIHSAKCCICHIMLGNIKDTHNGLQLQNQPLLTSPLCSP